MGDAFGNALGSSIADGMQPGEQYSLTGMGAKFGEGSSSGSVRLGTGDDGLSLNDDNGIYLSQVQEGGLRSGQTLTDFGDPYADGDGMTAASTAAERKSAGAGRGFVNPPLAGSEDAPAQRVEVTDTRAPWYERLAYRLQNMFDPESNAHVNWARDLSVLGMPSRLLGGLDAIARGPAGYDEDGQPVFWNERMQGLQRQEEIGLELASLAMVPTPGLRGGAVARSGLTFGDGLLGNAGKVGAVEAAEVGNYTGTIRWGIRNVNVREATPGFWGEGSRRQTRLLMPMSFW